MKDTTTRAIEVVREAGEIVVKRSTNVMTVAQKGQANLVTDLDLEVEDFVRRSLQRYYPDYFLISEEGFPAPHHGEGPLWVLDPIDGTTNLIHGYPHIAISLALICKDEINTGVIYNPLKNEIFYAERGAGAFLDGKVIKVSDNTRLEDSIIGFGLPYDRTKSGQVFARAERVYSRSQDVKRKGPAGLDIAYVACGRLDGYFEVDLEFWDIAAGIVILEEAKGKISDWSGSALRLSSGKRSVLATNGTIHSQLTELLKEEG